MNPCIDCRAMMYREAKKHMENTGADFIVTGEVLFQRPMSQNRRALHIIEEETGTAGKVLRPLSAKHLPPIEAEKNNLIKREMLGDIKGRSRKGQLSLARHYSMEDPPNAAGGCLLTDPAFSKRIKDTFEHADGIPSINDVELLKFGRHFRMSRDAKLIVGRNMDENEKIKSMFLPGDMLLEAKDYVGPTCLLRSRTYDESVVRTSAGILLRYADSPKDDAKCIVMATNGNNDMIEIHTESAQDEAIAKLRI
jgi:tRNA-specific 2-thiouridylase